jgi:group I intron endonuclease
MIIYKTTNLINQKFYVGKDTHNNPNYYGSGKRLKLAIQKYGLENFKKEIIEVCDSIEKLNEREKFWIRELNAISEGYNISLGGDGGDTISNNPRKYEIAKIHSQKMKMEKFNKIFYFFATRPWF